MTNQNKSTDKNESKREILRPIHTDFDSAYVIESYPYGAKRTQMRVWIETKKATKKQEEKQRVCRVTLNPKTQKWNKPKKSTYSMMIVMYIDNETGHLETDSVHEYSIVERAGEFLDSYGEILTDEQKEKLMMYKAANYVRKELNISIYDDGRGKFYTAMNETLTSWGREDLAKKIGA